MKISIQQLRLLKERQLSCFEELNSIFQDLELCIETNRKEGSSLALARLDDAIAEIQVYCELINANSKHEDQHL